MNTTTTPEAAGEPPEPEAPELTEPSEEVPVSEERRSPVRAASLVLGVVLLVSGVAMLGYVGWQYWGTDWVSKGKQASLRTDLKAQWQYPTVADLLGPQSNGASLGSAIALVRIPAFGADYEMPLVEGVRDSDLARGIGHFPGTGPGQIGNFALAAHRVTNGEPFRDMPDLRPGDQIIVETSDATYTYVLDTNPNDLIVPFTEDWVIDPVPVPPKGEAPPGMPTFASETQPNQALITLTTCSELFHTDNRMVAFGHLASTTPK
jgi:sortase A